METIALVPQSRVERFLQTHARLEKFLRRQLNEGPGKPYKEMVREMAKRDPVVRDREPDLLLFANLRNALAHDPPVQGEEPIADPREDAVIRFEKLVDYVLDPPTALDIAVPVERTFSATFDDSVIKVVIQMNLNTYTHVPILKDRQIVAVFSESSLFRGLAEMGGLTVDDHTPIGTFRPFVGLKGHISETFAFVSQTTVVEGIADLFRAEFRERRRLGAVFVTESGKETEPLLGLVTAWDVAGWV